MTKISRHEKSWVITGLDDLVDKGIGISRAARRYLEKILEAVPSRTALLSVLTEGDTVTVSIRSVGASGDWFTFLIIGGTAPGDPELADFSAFRITSEGDERFDTFAAALAALTEDS